MIEFVIDEFLDDPDTEITQDTKLKSSGLIDSFSLVSLQTFIGKGFGKRIPVPSITPESFVNVRQILRSSITSGFFRMYDEEFRIIVCA